jgi:putative resolvase
LGLDGNRVKLGELLANPQVGHRDRLARFSVEHRETALAAAGRRIVVLDRPGRGEIQVLRSMCARRYGRRSALPLSW